MTPRHLTVSRVRQILDEVYSEDIIVENKRGSMEDKIRIKILGDIDGYKIEGYVYDSDLVCDPESPLEIFSNIEDGVVQEALVQFQAHSIGPFYREKSSASSGADSRTSTAANKWACPVHGGSRIMPNQFAQGKSKCAIWQAKSESPERPDWAQYKLATMNDGQERWY